MIQQALRQPEPGWTPAQKQAYGEYMSARRSVYVLADPDYLGQTGVIARPKRVKGPTRAIPYDEVLERLLSRRAA